MATKSVYVEEEKHCDRCGETITAEESAAGWPVSVATEQGDPSQDFEAVCPSCYGEGAYCQEGHLLSGDTDSSECATCDVEVARRTHMANRYDQAVADLNVGMTAEVVRVRDGVDTWVAPRQGWDDARETLEHCEPYAGEDGGAEAYSALCALVRRYSRHEGGLISNQGADEGSPEDCRRLATVAVEADLLSPDEALAARFDMEV